MKNKSALRSLVGCNQHELAMLLGITRSQLAMYETGKRQLPAGAFEKLAELLVQVQTRQKSASRQVAPRSEDQIAQLKKLLHENQYQLAMCERKLDLAYKKQNAIAKVQELQGALAIQAENGQCHKVAFDMVNIRAGKCNTDAESAALLKLEVRREVLKFEQEVIERRLQELV